MHTWIFLATLCIAFVFFSTLPTLFFLQTWAFTCFYSLLCSLRQQLCPRSATAALQSGRLPQTTLHSGDEPSSDLGCSEREKGWVGQLCQAPPPSMQLSSGSKCLPEKREKSPSPCFSCFNIENTYYHTMNVLRLLSDTKIPAIFFDIQHTFFICNCQVPDHVIIALGAQDSLTLILHSVLV